MDRGKQREIASRGGRAAHQKGTAHEFSSEEAAEAGRKGGRARSLAQGRSEEEVLGEEPDAGLLM
jgi:general stress protein YciG